MGISYSVVQTIRSINTTTRMESLRNNSLSVVNSLIMITALTKNFLYIAGSSVRWNGVVNVTHLVSIVVKLKID